jgi:hypothetical protein
MSVLSTPTFALQPAAEKMTLSSNYLTSFDFLNQYLPDTYEKEFERFGNRSVSSFLRMVGAEMPSMSDQIKWAEQGRLHVKYTDCTSSENSGAGVGNAAVTFTVADTGATTAAVRVGQTVMMTPNAPNATTKGDKAVVTAVSGLAVTVKWYGNDVYKNSAAGNKWSMMIYGSEFKKGTDGMSGSIEPEPVIKDNKPIILKDTYQVAGSDLAQIGWIEVTTENGATGFMWYLKAEHETRLRFDDYLETAMIEAVPAIAGGGAAVELGTGAGSKGVFYEVNNNGNVWGAGNPTTLADFDTVIQRLDKQGAIEENVIFLNRDFSFAIDDMLAAQNSYGAGGTSYGLFDNDENMALNLGFTGFRRGYDFYKTDWKYLNDPTMRGGLTSDSAAATTSNVVTGLLVPAGSTSVYDQVLGKNAKRPFLHVRYRASEADDRRYKTWITGSAGGAMNEANDFMQVNFLSERCVCTMGANNFFLFRYGA